MQSKSIIATIPARGGSKGVPKKNIKTLRGYPLIAYSIIAAKLAKQVDRVIVSTDSDEIAEVARMFGAEVPFLRPVELAQDDSPDNEHIIHAIEWFERWEGQAPDLLVHLRPTTPLREPDDIDKAITRFNQYPEATSLRAAHVCPVTPQKIAVLQDDGFFTGFTTDDMEVVNTPRQRFPTVYLPNGYVDVISVPYVKETGKLHNKVLSFIVPLSTDIDTEEDFEYVASKLDGNPIFNYLESNYCKLKKTYNGDL